MYRSKCLVLVAPRLTTTKGEPPAKLYQPPTSINPHVKPHTGTVLKQHIGISNSIRILDTLSIPPLPIVTLLAFLKKRPTHKSLSISKIQKNNFPSLYPSTPPPPKFHTPSIPYLPRSPLPRPNNLSPCSKRDPHLPLIGSAHIPDPRVQERQQIHLLCRKEM